MKNFLVAALMLCSVVSFAQNKFIEVEVTDTITLKPLTFQCSIYLKSDIYDVMVDSAAVAYDDDYNPMAEQEKQKNKLQDVKRKLEAKKYKVLPLEQNGQNMLGRSIYGQPESGWMVMLNSEADVVKLKELVKNDAYVEVSVLKYADEAKAEEQLIKKLVDKAKAKAVIIASYSGLKSGKILEVREGKRGGELETFMLEVMKTRNSSRSSGYNGSLAKTFIVKFAAE